MDPITYCIYARFVDGQPATSGPVCVDVDPSQSVDELVLQLKEAVRQRAKVPNDSNVFFHGIELTPGPGFSYTIKEAMMTNAVLATRHQHRLDHYARESPYVILGCSIDVRIPVVVS
jgi:hypothetical protein